ncbi:class I SAM-dependent methyltransferase [Oceaniglobus ichthyenteri]|uniref:class I SAM-dependent methyltransferase n=1 Tax=Oceaniglobus ichthyenteri TaxID=2136177 RepID=UPI000D3BDBAF|nr:SAM-dependent methyltransferase [Oceaniglobus ichthyenteri]
MNALNDLLLRQIAAQGPLSVAEYMTLCLLHPEHGYYTTRDPLGVSGDFITAPEISQVFGELIGLCLAQAWQDRGAPSPFILGELGPGRGTLMADMLRATKSVPGFHAAMQVHLIEASPVLRTEQARLLGGYAPHWHEHVTDLPDLPLFLVANEFFDALPIRQFLRDGGAWRERVIGARDGTLVFGLTDPVAPPALSARLADTTDGDMVETSASATALAGELGRRIADFGGVALIIDYGSDKSLGDTFQAVRAHQKLCPLTDPGTCDLTAHVDFGALAKGLVCKTAPLTTQGAFLNALGSGARHGALARGKSEAMIESLIAAHRRLTHPSEMGQLFKVLALYSDTGPAPVGTEP